MNAFLAIARVGSYIAAAHRLGMAPNVRTPGARAMIARRAGIIVLANDIYA